MFSYKESTVIKSIRFSQTKINRNNSEYSVKFVRVVGRVSDGWLLLITAGLRT